MRAHRLALTVFTSLLLIGFMVGCSTSTPLRPTTVTNVAIPDTSNNRVLIYAPPFTTNENAAIVLGQQGFTTSITGTSASALATPAFAAYDRFGNLFVSDMGNCRVLGYHVPLGNGMSASLVLGQTDFDSNSCGSPSANTLDSPSGIAVDSKGNLWVSDSSHGRVLEYAPPFTIGMPATLAIGRPDLTSGGPCGYPTSVTDSTLCEPLGIAFDKNGNLWVADMNDNRVLEFTPPFSTGMRASVALGQPDLTSGGQCAGSTTTTNSVPVTGSTLCEPLGVASDTSGNLWVADSIFHRVLEFTPPFSDGMAASAVLGQPDFTSGTGNQGGFAGAGTMNSPEGVLFDSAGRLLVGDTGNNRTLVFDGPFRNGMNATAALGQPDLSSGSANQGGSPSAATENAPLGAGPSWIALLTLAVLIGIWAMWPRKQRRSVA